MVASSDATYSWLHRTSQCSVRTWLEDGGIGQLRGRGWGRGCGAGRGGGGDTDSSRGEAECLVDVRRERLGRQGTDLEVRDDQEGKQQDPHQSRAGRRVQNPRR